MEWSTAQFNSSFLNSVEVKASVSNNCATITIIIIEVLLSFLLGPDHDNCSVSLLNFEGSIRDYVCGQV